MHASGSVAVLALNIRQVLEGIGQGVKRSILQDRGKGPFQLRGDIIKSAIYGLGIGVVADRMAGETAGAVMITEDAVHAVPKDGVVKCFRPRIHHIFGETSTVAGSA